MRIITRAKGQLRIRLARLVQQEVQKELDNIVTIVAQLSEFRTSSREDRMSFYTHTEDPYSNLGYFASLKDRLLAAGALWKTSV